VSVLWVLEQNIFEEECVERFIDEIHRQGHKCSICQYVPFRDGNLSDISGEKHSVFYGSLNLAQQILATHDVEDLPIVFLDPKQFECAKYYAYFRRWLLNYPYVMFPYSELADAEYREWLFDILGSSNALFIRPSTGNKVFTGQVITREGFEEQFCLLNIYNSEPHTMLVAAAPRNIEVEWRFVVADGKVLTGSQYKIKGNIEYKSCNSGPVFEYAQKVVDSVRYIPDRIWTLDICTTSEGMYVLEIGSFSCAGLYACDVEPIVNKVSEIVLELEYK